MGFLAALKESVLEMLLGRYQLEAWRSEQELHEKQERIAQKHCEEALEQLKRNGLNNHSNGR